MKQFPNEKVIMYRIVYYGPALCGKTTNLESIFKNLNPGQKIYQDIQVAKTQGDNTLFYEFLPIIAGGDVLRVAGNKVKLEIYTVPGQVHHASTRKLVLHDVDGVVFVADSQRSQRQLNIDALSELKTNLAGLNRSHVPILMQFNKQDLPGAMPETEMVADLLTTRNEPHTLSSAITGQGVKETLRLITQMTVDHTANN